MSTLLGKSRRPLAATGLAAAVLVGLASPALAETDVHTDARNDVALIGPGGGLGNEPQPERTDPDIRSIKVVHGASSVVVRIKVADLDPAVGHLVAGRIRTAEGDAAFGWGAKPGRPVRGGVFTADGKRCRAATAPKIDPDSSVVRVTVPRSCLGDPEWVRVGAGLASYTRLDGGDLYVDDAQSEVARPEFALGARLSAEQPV